MHRRPTHPTLNSIKFYGVHNLRCINVIMPRNFDYRPALSDEEGLVIQVRRRRLSVSVFGDAHAPTTKAIRAHSLDPVLLLSSS